MILFRVLIYLLFTVLNSITTVLIVWRSIQRIHSIGYKGKPTSIHILVEINLNPFVFLLNMVLTFHAFCTPLRFIMLRNVYMIKKTTLEDYQLIDSAKDIFEGTFYYGDDPDYVRLRHYALHGSAQTGSIPNLKTVGCHVPNAWGLHDMHGSTWEWCSDRYAPSYKKASAKDKVVGSP